MQFIKQTVFLLVEMKFSLWLKDLLKSTIKDRNILALLYSRVEEFSSLCSTEVYSEMSDKCLIIRMTTRKEINIGSIYLQKS